MPNSSVFFVQMFTFENICTSLHKCPRLTSCHRKNLLVNIPNPCWREKSLVLGEEPLYLEVGQNYDNDEWPIIAFGFGTARAAASAPLELLESWKLCPRVMPYLVPEWQGLWENSPTAKPILLERPKRSQSSEVIPIFFCSARK